MRAQLVGVTRHHGSQVVLDAASLDVGPMARIRLVGPNGVGKSTVLRLLARDEAPDRGSVRFDPPGLTVAHTSRRSRSAYRGDAFARLARQTGVTAAEHELEASASALTATARDNARVESTQASSDRYDGALSRFLALGGGDLEARAARLCAELGLVVSSIARSPGFPAARLHGRRSPRSCSGGPTSSCSTSRRTTSTSTGLPA